MSLPLMGYLHFVPNPEELPLLLAVASPVIVVALLIVFLRDGRTAMGIAIIALIIAGIGLLAALGDRPSTRYIDLGPLVSRIGFSTAFATIAVALAYRRLRVPLGRAYGVLAVIGLVPAMIILGNLAYVVLDRVT